MGAYGMLGTSLSKHLKAVGYSVLSQGRRQVAECKFNPNNRHKLAELIDREQVDTIINLVALTNLDLCEEQVAEAYHVNSGVVAAIVEALGLCSSGSKPHLIHISTDQLYSGAGPHSEEHVHPINVYGLSKYTGELIALQAGATILRTNFYGLSHCPERKSFTDWAIQSLRDGIPITVFEDVRFSALHIKTLCEFVGLAIGHRLSGVYNLGCRDSMSKAEFVFSLVDLLGLSGKLLKIGASTDHKFKAKRSLDMTLRVERIEKALGVTCPSMQHQIEETAKEYRHETSTV
jgi:dTDP-4-dehydrorhamnose reductase